MGDIESNNASYTHIDAIMESLRRNNLIEEESEEEQKLRIEKDKSILILKESYWKIIDLLKDYSDAKEEYYYIIALWIIGT